MTSMSHRSHCAYRVSALAASLAFAAFAAPASAQWKPTQPIRVIIPYAAGGTSDIIARTMSDEVSKRLGQPFTIENRGGGATQIGTSAVAKADPDGHTILLVGNTVSINPSLFKTLPYDTLKDLTPDHLCRRHPAHRRGHQRPAGEKPEGAARPRARPSPAPSITARSASAPRFISAPRS